MTRKLMITHWFGPLPDWMPAYLENVERLQPHGYDWLLETNLEAVTDRVHRVLRLDFPGVSGGSKMHDLRPALGLLYADELEGYDFWGHTDLDCVYGRVWEWLTDELLATLDIHSNHWDYMCGPWSLYRNQADLRGLFYATHGWRDQISRPDTTGWVEKSFTATVDRLHAEGKIRRHYSFWQTRHIGQTWDVYWDGDRLMDGDTEIFMAHFNRTKTYPQACLAAAA